MASGKVIDVPKRTNVFIIAQAVTRLVTPKERELFQGMGNCYATCHASFEDTVRMVGSNRGLSPEEVKEILRRIKEKYGRMEEYKTLRNRLPEDFPL